jgi:hypothetical protein
MHRYLITRTQSSTQVQALLSVIASVGEVLTSNEKTVFENPTGEASPIHKKLPHPRPSSNAILTSLFGRPLVSSL